jgi:hypothetical protein
MCFFLIFANSFVLSETKNGLVYRIRDKTYTRIIAKRSFHHYFLTCASDGVRDLYQTLALHCVDVGLSRNAAPLFSSVQY